METVMDISNSWHEDNVNIGSGRVLEKIPGSGSGSGRVGVLKNTVGYFRVSFLLSGIAGYFWVYWISSLFFGGSEPNIKVFSDIAKIRK